MSSPLILEPEAEADIASTFAWYEAQRQGLGDDFMLCTEGALEAIAHQPQSFPVVHRQTRRALVRRFPYLVLFVELPTLITVVGVFHTSQDPERWTPRLR